MLRLSTSFLRLTSTPSFLAFPLVRLYTRSRTFTMAEPKQKEYEAYWTPPKGPVDAPLQLRVANSFTKSKDVFVPNEEGHVTWYNCGPTVYDTSHMGHARNYVTQDIIRRILRDYFGYTVNFVMNITDIDDKIIKRARQNYLYQPFIEAHPHLSEDLLLTLQNAWNQYFEKKLASLLSPKQHAADHKNEVVWVSSDWEYIQQQVESDPEWIEKNTSKPPKVDEAKMHVKTLNTSRKGILAAQANLKNTLSQDSAETLSATQDIIKEWLDQEKGSTITDHSIFQKHATYFEKDFFNDMAALNVEKPDTTTRVSDYVPQVVSFVEEIIRKGFAYEIEGSVYFDKAAFDGAPCATASDPNGKHVYAKLEPWSKNNKALIQEGEGSLNPIAQQKKSREDFVLWKFSKPGEPSWPSPWGQGRPGWHIECSVMASDVLGQNIDIHSGGIDLAFPHHDNEIAQSEAYHGCTQWINYFLHTGHLHIEGQKMSKSLKNLIPIKKALEDYTPRQLRLCFLQHPWKGPMTFSAQSISEAKSNEMTFLNFFSAVNAFINENRDVPTKALGESGKQISQNLRKAQRQFREAMCDSFDTAKGIDVLLALVSDCNVYIKRGRNNIDLDLVESIAKWITSMLRMFGLDSSSSSSSIGLSDERKSGSGKAADGELMPYLHAWSNFRDEIRRLSISGAKSGEFLKLCDYIRDEDMVELGVMLDDQEDGRALVKLVPREILLEAKQEKQRVLQEKLDRKLKEEADRIAKLEKGKIPPKELFTTSPLKEEYSEWDENGIPTKLANGEELPKKRRKNLQKEWEKQGKLHEQWLQHEQANKS